MNPYRRSASTIILSAIMGLLMFTHDLHGQLMVAQTITRGEILQSILFFVVGEALIILIFYRTLFKFLFLRRFRAQISSDIVNSLTTLYTLGWFTVMFFKLNLLPGWQWIGIFIFLGIVWLIHFGFTVLAKR